MKLKLENLFKQYKVSNVAFDSRRVSVGDVFFAIKGNDQDGNLFIDQALSKGAVLVLTDTPSLEGNKIIYIDNIRLALAIAARIFYPLCPDNIVAVTGTNGKSSVVSYVHQILYHLGFHSASLGTLGLNVSKKIDHIPQLTETTADPISLMKILHLLKESDIDYVAFEASSHGIDQDRFGDLQVSTAAFTSFSQDHLDYHGTMEKYLESKMKLFTEHLAKDKEAVISKDDYFDEITSVLDSHNISYTGVGRGADIDIVDCKQSIYGQEVIFNFKSKEYNFKTKIIGSFQASNLLIATKLVANLGINFDQVVDVLPNLVAVKGRLERVTDVDSDYHVFVDYAHTPDSLLKSLVELGKIKPQEGRLIVVFGCGGDRDKTKRPLMGKIATENADIVIITDDNPRTEDPETIRSEIARGAQSASIMIGDRKEAICYAVSLLSNEDVLLIAGKGHEEYQIIADKKIDFSDQLVARDAIKLARN